MSRFALAAVARIQVKRHASLYDIAPRKQSIYCKLLKKYAGGEGGFELSPRFSIAQVTDSALLPTVALPSLPWHIARYHAMTTWVVYCPLGIRT
jgi:hypothetical protein